MTYIIAAFRSRSHTMQLYNTLINKGINCSIVNTPRGAYIGCGISVKISESQIGQSQMLINQLSLTTFAGFFHVTQLNERTLVSRM